jgi:hypothetical protein
MSFRDQIIAVQRRILGAIKRDIRDSLGPQSSALRRYYRTYKRRFEQPFTEATLEELLRACAGAEIIYVGDYHTLAAAQQMPLKLLRALWARRRHRWILALEMVQISDQSATDLFVEGRMSQEAYLREIEYDKTWGFPWEHYRPLFEFAREHGVRVVGINCEPEIRDKGLRNRDTCAAMAIAQAAAANPGVKILVLDGDLHVAPAHLPHRVNAFLHGLGARRRSLIIYQNSETLHWRLVQENREREVQTVRLSPREFAVQHTHPIVKLQSYLNWLEYEQELAPVIPLTLRDEEEDSGPDIQDQIHRFIASIVEALRLDGDFSDFAVYTVEDLDFLDDLRDVHVYTNEEIDLVAIQILKGESQFLPDGHMLYLANLTVNHAAEEAAHYINFKLSGPPPRIQTHVDDLYHRTMREALGFFGSKIINPGRLAYLAEDFADAERRLRGKRLDVKGRDLRKISRLVLHHLEVEKEVVAGKHPLPRRLPRRYFRQYSVFLGVAHALGYRLGTWLFAAFEQGIITRETMRALFSDPFRKRGSAQRTYFDLLGRLQGLKIPHTRRIERL